MGNAPNLKINNCNGRVYMGLTFRLDNKQLITSFDELLQWKTVHKLTKGQSVNCNPEEFGVDPWPGLSLQCFCEPFIN